MKQVVISVVGGVAELAYASDGVNVEIVDLDNAKEEGKDTEKELARWIENAKKKERQ